MLVFGGRRSGLASQRTSVLAIDPANGHVHRAGRLPLPLSDLAAVATPRGLEVLGGRDEHGVVHDEIWGVATARVAATTGSRSARVPALLDRDDVYAGDRPGELSPVARRARAFVYVPNSRSNSVDVISQRSGRIVRHFTVGALPQHVTPSWDLRTLYVTNDAGNSLTPINPRTGRPGRRIRVLDPYNMYFTADGRYAIVVAEAHRQLDFRYAHSMKLHHTLRLPQCNGVDHMDFTADVLRRRHGVERCLAVRRSADAQRALHADRARCARALSQSRQQDALRDQSRRRHDLTDRLPPASRACHLAHPGRLAGHGRAFRRREGALGQRPLQRGGLRDLDALRTRPAAHQGGAGPARPVRVAAAGRYSIGHTGILR
jgi:hypothetical protein